MSKKGEAAAGQDHVQSAPERPSVTGIEEQCDYVEDKFGVLCRRLVPMLIDAVVNTDGTEGAKITVTIGFKPGGAKSKSRLAVVGGIAIPGGGFEQEVVIRGADDDRQLVLFTD